MTLEAFELLIGKVVQTDSSGTILEPLAPATTPAKLCFTGLLFFLFQAINRLWLGGRGAGQGGGVGRAMRAQSPPPRARELRRSHTRRPRSANRGETSPPPAATAHRAASTFFPDEAGAYARYGSATNGKKKQTLLFPSCPKRSVHSENSKYVSVSK
ncbi:hypothetical protein EVAR_102777_1 [Eumeta japonica]|uniref:Uncharacterized protein n=1 Tax=Eumeta variegata TaxID=151549 RepID=A0A4C1TJ05_EUMVA|nr:hypothetical protein EVAR_102777_1 [Eumeta japonica]